MDPIGLDDECDIHKGNQANFAAQGGLLVGLNGNIPCLYQLSGIPSV